MKYGNKDSVRYIVFKEDKTWYGVALELNITEEGVNPIEAMNNLFEAMQKYVEIVRKLGSFKALNQELDKEYQELWRNLEDGKTGKSLTPYCFGKALL